MMKFSFKMKSHQFLCYCTLLFMPSLTQAAVFTLPPIETNHIEPIFNTLGSAFAFRSVEGAGDLGAVWGLYFGAGGGGTSGTNLKAISPDAPEYLPNADVSLGLGLPLGLTLELGGMPKIAYKGTHVSKMGGAIKWTATRTLLRSLPIDLAGRLGYSHGTIGWSQPLSGGTVSIEYDSRVVETQIAASKRFGALGFGLEPFVGLGFVTHTSKLSGSGTANLFGSSFPGGTTSLTDKYSSVWYQAGLMIHLLFLGISAEYDNMFGLSSYTGKVTLRL